MGKKLEKHIVEENGIGYTLKDDGLYYPDLELVKEADYPIGKYGAIRRKYLKTQYNAMYRQLQLSGKLNEHLHGIEEACLLREETIIEQMKTVQGVTEKLKAENQILWVSKVNNIKACAEEIVLKEIVYV